MNEATPGPRPGGGVCVNVTIAPATGLAKASLTVATRGAPNVLPAFAACPEPEVVVMLTGAPGRFVKLNDGGVAVSPATAVVTE